MCPSRTDQPSEFHTREDLPVEPADPAIRARNLFARNASEFPIWDSVAKHLDEPGNLPPPPDVEASYARLKSRMKSVASSDSAFNPADKRQVRHVAEHGIRHSRLQLLQRKAVPLFAGLLGAALLFIAIPRGDSTSSAGATVTTYTTANAERSEIILSDGSHVVLNVGSRLQVPSNFGSSARTIFLEGEAQFTVENDPARPFIVQAGNTEVRDLATRFIVRAYRDVGRTVVAVAEGRVAVQAAVLSQPQSAILDEGGVAVISLNSGLHVEAQKSLEEYFGWTEGNLGFSNVPIGEVLAQFGRWYDVECQVSDPSLLEGDITFKFTGHSLTDQTLRDLGDVLGAHVEKRGRVILFTPLT